MAVRSASAMIIPMLEFQAQQFMPNGLHHTKMDAERSMYAEIQRRLAELSENAESKEENEVNFAGTSAFPNTSPANFADAIGNNMPTGSARGMNNNNISVHGNRLGGNSGHGYTPGESYGFGHINHNTAINPPVGDFDDYDEEEEYSSDEEIGGAGRAFGNIYS